MTISPVSTRLTAGLLLAGAMLDAALFFRLVVLPESSQAIAAGLTIHALLAIAGAYGLGSWFGRAEGKVVPLALAAFWPLLFMPMVAGPGLFIVLAVGTRASEPIRVSRRIGVPLGIRWDNAELKPRLPIRQATPERIADDLDAKSSDLAQHRLQAMLRVRRLPTHMQTPLARLALADPADDVRLFAFSLIERLRSDHESALRKLTSSLEPGTSEITRSRVHLRIAEVHWEMVYHGLVEAAVMDHSLTEALSHIDRSIESDPGHGSAYALRGRILLRLGEVGSARGAFERALELKHPADKVLSYLAECVFRLRDFVAVRAYLLRLRSVDGCRGAMSPVMEHWQ